MAILDRQIAELEAYGWFTEGFDTVDLQEAQALLAPSACAHLFTRVPSAPPLIPALFLPGRESIEQQRLAGYPALGSYT